VRDRCRCSGCWGLLSQGKKSIVEGGEICKYIKETAAEYGIDKKVRFEHRVVEIEWSTADACWTITAEVGSEPKARKIVKYSCNMLLMCTGYYRYEAGFTPSFPGIEKFSGPVIHPQLWDPKTDYTNKQVVVIGSGATAYTVVPHMAERGAAHVTMLQRSPTYVVALPSHDKLGMILRALFLPLWLVYFIIRWKNIIFGLMTFSLARKYPDLLKKKLREDLLHYLGEGFDIDTHVSPLHRSKQNGKNNKNNIIITPMMQKQNKAKAVSPLLFLVLL
jgi:monooxygenase